MKKTSNLLKQQRRDKGLDIYGGLKKPQRRRFVQARKQAATIVFADYLFRGMNAWRKHFVREVMLDKARSLIENGLTTNEAVNDTMKVFGFCE
jgi:hypothetical protein